MVALRPEGLSILDVQTPPAMRRTVPLGKRTRSLQSFQPMTARVGNGVDTEGAKRAISVGAENWDTRGLTLFTFVSDNAPTCPISVDTKQLPAPGIELVAVGVKVAVGDALERGRSIPSSAGIGHVAVRTHDPSTHAYEPIPMAVIWPAADWRPADAPTPSTDTEAPLPARSAATGVAVVALITTRRSVPSTAISNPRAESNARPRGDEKARESVVTIGVDAEAMKVNMRTAASSATKTNPSAPNVTAVGLLKHARPVDESCERAPLQNPPTCDRKTGFDDPMPDDHLIAWFPVSAMNL